MSVQAKIAHAAGAGQRQSVLRQRLSTASLGVVAALFLMIVPLAAPAQAIFSGPAPGGEVRAANVEVIMTGTGAGTGVTGGLPPVDTPFVPTAGYPSDVPAGYVTLAASFAGVITTVDNDGNTQQMYCIDIRTSTYAGLGYESGSWDESNVPNIGYVNRILNSYYPDQPGFPVAPSVNDQAASVQAAIWFFSDGYVLAATDPLRTLVEEIVAAVLLAGPLTEPAPPDVNIVPPVAAGPADGVTGPFTVTAGGGAELTVAVTTGFTLYTDAAGTIPLADPTVASGAQLWVRSEAQTTDPAVITAEAVVPVETGNVYLYAGNNPAVSAAQKLILAADAEVSSVAQATAEFFVAGDLVVNKSFAGAAVGAQGAISLTIDCGPAGVYPFDIPAGATTAVSTTIVDVPVGTVCTVTELVSGSTSTVTVTAQLPDPVEIIEGENLLNVANTVAYNPGSLLVTKTIKGAGASLQDDIVIHVQCGFGTVDDVIVLPAGTTAGDYTRLYENIPSGTPCRITEPTSGANEDVTVETTITGEGGILPAETLSVQVTNTYAPVPATKRLPKTGADGATNSVAIAGGGAVLIGSLVVLGSMRRRRS